jgi:predicted ArsR family transcriptional regulator
MNTITNIISRVLSRTTDPVSSKIAASTVILFAYSHEEKILDALDKNGWLTASEIGFIAGMTNTQVCRRLADMQRRQLVARTGDKRKGDNGRIERVWKAI